MSEFYKNKKNQEKTNKCVFRANTETENHLLKVFKIIYFKVDENKVKNRITELFKNW